jgi:hypothetical protein
MKRWVLITCFFLAVILIVLVGSFPMKGQLHTHQDRCKDALRLLKSQIERSAIAQEYLKPELVRLSQGKNAHEISSADIFNLFEYKDFPGIGRQLLGSPDNLRSAYRDLWNNDYHFKVFDPTSNQDTPLKLRVWSSGPNQHNEDASGDDIVVDILLK